MASEGKHKWIAKKLNEKISVILYKTFLSG